MVRIKGMEKLTLPSVEVQRHGEKLEITHKKTGMKTVIGAIRLDAWFIRVLREALSVKENAND